MINADELAFEEYQPLWMQLNDENIVAMPYIGWNDIDDKEIYVGDIIKFDDIAGEGEDVYDIENIAEVVIQNGRIELIKFKYDETGVCENMISDHEEFIIVFETCRVIGNVLENKELLDSN